MTTPQTLLGRLAEACLEASDLDTLLSRAQPLVEAIGAEGHDDHSPLREAAAAILASAVQRVRAEAELADLTQRVDNAQQLANMGDYDWHIASDTNRWSDQLFRIYGHEPQAFNASYERFLSLIHPDDRERITAVHQSAYASGEPYQMIERIQRPDGETRYLSSNGQVILDDTGAPVRMRGTCIDITDLVLAEQEGERAKGRLEAAQVRRRQAVDINDNIIQGLTAAVYSLERFDVSAAAEYVRLTLSSARAMMNDLLERLDGQDLQPGDLVRESVTTLRGRPDVGDEAAPAAAEAPLPTARTVLIVDDSEDMRMLVRHVLERQDGITVVGEAETGTHGIRLATELQPDLVLLDLAMPEVDGLEALPLILVAAPGTKVIVLSGFDRRLGDRAVAAGASQFVQKGGGVQELLHAIRTTLPPEQTTGNFA